MTSPELADNSDMVRAPVLDELTAAAAGCARAEKRLAAARDKRDRLIVAAADQGIQYRAIAAAVALSPAGVVRVLAIPHD